MSAERSTESIIDLLYGELSEEEERAMRAELADSPELQSEFDEFDSMLGRVREVMPLEEPSPEIHASILEAARVAAEQPADDRLIRRQQPESQSFWKRIGSGQGSQIALVAAVLIAGMFVVRFMGQSDSPLHAPASDISAMREAAPAMEAPKVAAQSEAEEGAGAAAPPEELAEGEAIADQWTESAEEPAPPAGLEQAPEAVPADSAKDSLQAELQRTAEMDERRDEAKPKPKPKPRKRARSGKKKKSKPTATKSAAPAPNKNAKALEDSLNTDVFGGFGDDSDGISGRGSSQGSLELKEEAPAAEEEAQAYRPPKGSLSEVQNYWRQGDYNNAIRTADTFIASNEGSRTDKATAMLIKAQALEKQGKYSQAQRLLESIQKNYPGFESNTVEKTLEDLKRKNTRKQRKARPKMDKAMDEPAESYSTE